MVYKNLSSPKNRNLPKTNKGNGLNLLYMWYDKLIEQNKIPDFLLRKGIRKLLAQRLSDENKGDVEAQQAHLMELIGRLKASPIAVNTADANQQHYEAPTKFYQYCLGKNCSFTKKFPFFSKVATCMSKLFRRKYSTCTGFDMHVETFQ